MAGFVGDNWHGWNFPPYLQGFGGNVFRKAPDDLMPPWIRLRPSRQRILLASAARLRAGRRPFETVRSGHRRPQAGTRQLFHRRTHLPDAGGRCRQQGGQNRPLLGFSQGAGGTLPRLRDPCLGIPVGAKNKPASWEFIKWAMSRQMMLRAVKEKGYSSPSRRSIIEDPE